jgi:ribosomal-protein-alanine N-acetyltransferase
VHDLETGPEKARHLAHSVLVVSSERAAGARDRHRVHRLRSLVGGHPRHPLTPVPEGYTLRPLRLPADREAILAVLATANMHHVPSEEMHDFDVGEWHVAEAEGRIVGVAGFDLIELEGRLTGKTTLLAVVPEQRGSGIGRALQELRMRRMREQGAERVITNADRPETIAWYERNFGYRRVGEVPKVREFGLPDVDRWTTLEASLS